MVVIIVDCGDLASPDNGVVSFDNTVEGYVATYQCDNEFFVSGASSRTCGSDGMWSDEAPVCMGKL